MIRSQRKGMVQTEEQYAFLYKAINYYMDAVRIPAEQKKDASAEASGQRKECSLEAGGKSTSSTSKTSKDSKVDQCHTQ